MATRLQKPGDLRVRETSVGCWGPGIEGSTFLDQSNDDSVPSYLRIFVLARAYILDREYTTGDFTYNWVLGRETP